MENGMVVINSTAKAGGLINQNQNWISQSSFFGVPAIVWLGAIGAIAYLIFVDRD